MWRLQRNASEVMQSCSEIERVTKHTLLQVLIKAELSLHLACANPELS